jgi:peptidyl-prolyl cis-trans isomerase SurA
MALLLLPLSAQTETRVLDSVVAIVEDDVIMSSELRERLEIIKANLAQQDRPEPPQEVIVRQTLDQLILESIQMQQGQRAGVRISDAQLNQALNTIATKNGMTLDQFRMQLEQSGQSYQSMRENVRQEMIIQRVQAGNVNQRIEISEQEVDNYLQSSDGAELTAAEYHIVHALLAIPGDAPPEQDIATREYVDGLYQRIESGEAFNEVLSTSTGEYTFKGGDLGWRKASDLPSLFADVAPGMEIGQTSPPIRSPSGYHLIYMAEKRGGQTIIDQTHVRHILIKPTAIRNNDESRALAADLRQQVINGTDFAELAREYSDDIGSAQEGGDLGWTSPRQMVPEFEKVMNETDIDAISNPFQSQYGWHILQVLERREEDVSLTVARNRAMDVLHQRKYQEELDAWLRKIRDEAFVDIK